MTDSRDKQIFFVEDDDEVAEMLCTYFGEQGFAVTRSAWGEEAVGLIHEAMPDVVVLDIHLPDIDGYEVYRRLRRDRRTNHLPVIFLTERNEREDRLAGLELGAVDYINKPFDIHELGLRIGNALRRGELRPAHNALTGLPEGPLLLARLEAMLATPDWGVVLVELRGLDHFRDQYGFVAADDVTRAVGLILVRLLDELETGEAPFIAHAGNAAFLLITSAAHCPRLLERCRQRVEPAIPYFYSAADQARVESLPPAARLSLRLACHTAAGQPVSSLAALGTALGVHFGD
ncbi:MAG: response regulator [Anaerolineae bacterium]|nr:response regulator [Anaerolineae bacterium]